ncbi:CBS and ACT domain-containing protein [Nigerium massiliense]|uniref:CBS and ACT domain-containing protein n=1 Tax=Nigerium massiliense TaxID=1522317 RepID=UPI0005911FD1|nr:CBS and ACT domain-containing protein [Nigerium massiliense]
MFVKTRMTANPYTVTPQTRLPEAVELMEDKHVRHLPVVEDGRVVGVLAPSDIAAASPSQATTFSAGEITYLLAKLRVAKVMTRDPITISSDALLEEAAVLMRDNKIEMLPVVDDGTLVGVITESAILDAFIEVLGFRDPGTRFTIQAPDAPGVLSRLGAIAAKHGANIMHLAVYRGDGQHSTVLLGVNSRNTQQLEADAAAEGFEVLARLEND